MRKSIVFTIIGILVLLILMVSMYVSNVGFNNLKHVYSLSFSEAEIVFMEVDQYGNGLYLTNKENVKEANDLLVNRMSVEGWNYVTQEGAALIFERESEETVVTTKIWNRFYYIYSVEQNVVNIADQ